MSSIEEKFFETFEIEPKEYKGCNSFPCSNPGTECENCKDYKLYKTAYPRITDYILLALVCVAMEYRDYPTTVNIKNIKERTLRLLIGTKKYLKDTYSSEAYHNRLVRKVQALFKK